MRVKAFTLAEVLITLGIFGVVSMMVMPSLMQKYQKRKTISQFKKVYSTMSARIPESFTGLRLVFSWQ